MLDGCQRDWSGSRGPLPLQRLLLMMMMMMSALVKGELYWAYVPDPPILHPSIWEGPEIIVKVNDTRLLDQPATGRSDKREERRFNYTGSGIGLPICFSKRGSATTGCLPLYGSSLIRNDREKRPLLFGCNYPKGAQVNSPPPSPQSFPPCGEEELSSRTIHWKRCYVPAPARYNMTGTDQYILNWSGGE